MNTSPTASAPLGVLGKEVEYCLEPVLTGHKTGKSKSPAPCGEHLPHRVCEDSLGMP